MDLTLHLIINNQAGSGNGKKVAHTITTALTDKKYSFQTYPTMHQGHAVSLAQDLATTTLRPWTPEFSQESFPLLVVIGGDGTLHEVVNALADFDQIPLGYLPGGSGNDFARGIGLSRDPLQALEHLLNLTEPQSYHLLAYQEALTHTSGLVTNNIGLGIDAAIVASANTSQSKQTLNKFNIGFLTYFFTALNILFKQPGFPLTLQLNGMSHTFNNAFLCTITNHPYFGGGVSIVPTANIKQANMDVIIVERINLWKIFYLISLILRKKHLGTKHVHHFTTNELTISSPSKQAIHTDGEVITPQAAEFSVHSTSRLFWL